jgi:hypothetical protein
MWPMGFLSLKNTLSSQLLLTFNAVGDFNETWYKEISHCRDVHIVKGTLFNYISSSYGPGLDIFFEKIICLCSSY